MKANRVHPRYQFAASFVTFIRRNFLFLMLLIILSNVFLSNLDNIQYYHGDENIWIFVGNKVFQLYFIKRDFANTFWVDNYATWGSYQPQVGKYVIGFGTYVAGYRNIPAIWYEYTKSLQENLLQGRVLDPQLVAAARAPIAVMGILCCVFTYTIATIIANRFYGIVAVIILVCSGLLLKYSHRAMVDVPALCFGLATIVSLLYTLKYIRLVQLTHILICGMTTGVLLGLALSSKMNTLLLVPVCWITLLIESISHKENTQIHILSLSCGLLISSCAIAVFILSNPFLYTHTFQGAQHLLSMSQFLWNQDHPWRTRTWSEKLMSLWEQTRDYAPLNALGLPIDSAFLFLGMLRISIMLWRQPALVNNSFLVVLVAWAIVSFVGITLWLPSNYDHYFLPLHPVKALVETYGLLWPIEGGFGVVQKWRTFASPLRS